MMALRVPHPDSLRARNENVSLLIDLHAVGNPLMSAARFFAKDAPVRYRAVCEVIHANVALLAVIHIELLSVGRESQSIRLRQFLGQKLDPAVPVETVNALKGSLLLLAARQIECGIGEVNCTVRANHDVVRTVEFHALEMVREDDVLAIGRYSNDGAQHAGAIDQVPLQVEGVSIGIAQINHALFASVKIHPEDLVEGLVADIDKAGWVPHGAFGKAETGRNRLELCIAAHKLPKFWGSPLQLELALRFLRARGAHQQHDGENPQ